MSPSNSRRRAVIFLAMMITRGASPRRADGSRRLDRAAVTGRTSDLSRLTTRLDTELLPASAPDVLEHVLRRPVLASADLGAQRGERRLRLLRRGRALAGAAEKKERRDRLLHAPTIRYPQIGRAHV